MCNGKDVNRKWLNENFQRVSKTGQYFTGSNTREVALNIVSVLDMHPCFVGKLDELLTKLIGEGAYKLSNGQLVSCDVASQVVKATTLRREVRRRAARRGKQQYRDLAASMQAEAPFVFVPA